MREYKLDKEEQEILKAVEKGEWEPVNLTQSEIKMYVQAAKNTLRKNKHVHIRLTQADLNGLKTRAIREGIPYQTLISSVLHKYVTGTLVPQS